MKVAVYTIAKNEEQFVERWYESAKDADYLLILDTGSTDGTRKKALELGIHVDVVHIKPWRFDIARNSSLAMIPDYIDYCIALDMDEVLVPGWREELEKAHAQGATRPRYNYTWSWNEDGTPGLQYGGDKIHSRFGYRWKHPVHETLTRYGTEPETQCWIDLQIEHHPDNTKSRGQYFPLLEMAVAEDPEDERNRFYFARELYYHKLYERAADQFRIYLNNKKAVWAPERSAAYRFLAKCEPHKAEMYLSNAYSEAPDRREAAVELAQFYHNTNQWEECYKYASLALQIENKPLEYLCENFAWGEVPYDLMALSSYHLGKYEEALIYGVKALELSPNNERLQANIGFYKEKALPNTKSLFSF
jgi:glycosyltransferase involved in cell wall biosynthesis